MKWSEAFVLLSKRSLRSTFCNFVFASIQVESNRREKNEYFSVHKTNKNLTIELTASECSLAIIMNVHFSTFHPINLFMSFFFPSFIRSRFAFFIKFSLKFKKPSQEYACIFNEIKCQLFFRAIYKTSRSVSIAFSFWKSACQYWVEALTAFAVFIVFFCDHSKLKNLQITNDSTLEFNYWTKYYNVIEIIASQPIRYHSKWMAKIILQGTNFRSKLHYLCQCHFWA